MNNKTRKKYPPISQLDILEARLHALTKAELAFNIKARKTITTGYTLSQLRYFYPIPSDANDFKSRYYRHH